MTIGDEMENASQYFSPDRIRLGDTEIMLSPLTIFMGPNIGGLQSAIEPLTQEQWLESYIVAIPPAIPQTPEEASKMLDIPWELREMLLDEALNFWMNYLQLSVAGKRRLVDVLTRCLVIEKEGSFFVDFPEMCLYSYSQYRLADFFCSLVKTHKRILVETHSEALFHRLRLHAMMDKDLGSKISVYFMDISEIKTVPIANLDYLGWPKGFMNDGLDEELCIAAIRSARLVDLKDKSGVSWPESFLAEPLNEEKSIRRIHKARLEVKEP